MQPTRHGEVSGTYWMRDVLLETKDIEPERPQNAE